MKTLIAIGMATTVAVISPCRAEKADERSSVNINVTVDGSVASVHGKARTVQKVLSNGNKKSRYGFTGRESLNQDLSASFKLEQSVDFDDTKRVVFDRTARVCIESISYGTACLGRDETPIFAAIDKGTTGIESTLVSALGSGTTTLSRVQQGVEYFSPSINGFYAKFMLSASEPAGSGSNSYRGAKIGYTAADKKTDMSLSFGEAVMSSGDNYTLGNFWAEHDFGPFQLGGRFFQASYRDRKQQVLVGNLVVPHDAWKFKAQIGGSRMTGESHLAGYRDGDSALQLGIGGEYFFSNGTYAYGRIAKLRNFGSSNQTMSGVAGPQLNGVMLGVVRTF